MAEPDRQHIAAFERASPMLLGLAYRILGSRVDAEDAVQDTYLKWRVADHAAIESPASWLTTTCTRRCLDMLRAGHRARVDYVGTWLPEPYHGTTEGNDPETAMTLAASLQTAFLLVLERLAPKERAAYLLHEIFDVAYPEIARTLGLQEATVRKLVSRARGNIDRAQVRHVTPVERQDKLLAAFRTAISAGDTGPLANLLSDEIALSADGGGKVPTLMQRLQGRPAVLDFITRSLRGYWAPYLWVVTEINGGRGIVLRDGDHVAAVVSFAYDAAGLAREIFILRNPDKLAGLEHCLH